ncbi:MAG TPA: hypothetical protein DCQ98_14775 [Planctomycetaceae bacterium]|nr:hypothetical protein [Planctomycetaceae bacterium]HRE99222.1 NfeD family protein [Pirellulaceae bacterium]
MSLVGPKARNDRPRYVPLATLPAVGYAAPVLAVALLIAGLGASPVAAQTPPAPADATTPAAPSPESSTPGPTAPPSSPLPGIVVRVPLPITGQTDARVQATIERQLALLPVASQSSERPILILEFDTLRGAGGRGSQFERCLTLARFLTSPAMDRVRTVAYLPGAEIEGAPVQPLTGHALLVALACEQWAMADEAAITSAGLIDDAADPFVIEAYRSVASRRRVLPEAMVESLVEPSRGLARAEMADETVRWVSIAELERLEAAGEVTRGETIIAPGEIATFDASSLFRRQLLELQVDGRGDLANRLGLDAEALSGDPAEGGNWTPVRIRLEGQIDSRQIQWALGSLEQRLAEGTDLVIVEIDSTGGEFTQALRLARRLLELDPLEVRTVAFVTGNARGGGAAVALACDHLLIRSEGSLGGPAIPEVTVNDLAAIEELLPLWSERGGTEPDWVRALIDPQIVVARYRDRSTGEERVMTERTRAALPAEIAVRWEPVAEVSSADGVDATEAVRVGLARHLVEGFDELAARYRIPSDLEMLQPTVAFRWIDRFARFIARPWVSWWLLLIGMMLLSSEMSSPGIGFPGFAAAICFSLYFWAQYLDGNAHWLEILMFMLGAVFLLFEIFVLPGFGLFGFGGIVLILSSIVLASQTFVVPVTDEDFARLPASLSTLVAIAIGMALPMYLIPNYIDRIPILRRLSLNPAADQAFENLSERESLVRLDHLKGKMGVAVTPLVPGGKIQVGDEVVSVISAGMAIDKGNRVVISEVRGSRIVVVPADPRLDG